MKISCKNGFNVIYDFRSPLKWIRLTNLTFNIQYIKKLKKYQTCQRGSKTNQASKDIIYTNQGNKERTATDSTKHVHTRATRPPDEQHTFLNNRRLTHNHRLVKYMYMSMRRCDDRL
jgi:hypothetical protein